MLKLSRQLRRCFKSRVDYAMSIKIVMGEPMTGRMNELQNGSAEEMVVAIL
jgi:hypothetical protein